MLLKDMVLGTGEAEVFWALGLLCQEPALLAQGKRFHFVPSPSPFGDQSLLSVYQGLLP